MSGGPISSLLRSRRAAPSGDYVKDRPTEAARLFARENKQIKDRLAALAQEWRARGAHGASYARELEAAMGWTPAGDPLTGCLPVTAEPSGPERVQAAVRRARGGEAPTPPQGYA